MKVVPGTLVDFYADGAIIAGVVLAEEKGRLRVVTESGREERIAPGRVLAAYQGPGRAALPAGAGAGGGGGPETARIEAARKAAAAHQAAAREARGSVDLPLVWDLLVDEGGERMLEELADLASGSRSAPAVAATLRALLEERLYFIRRGDLWEARPRSAVEELLHQREREARRAEARERFLTSAGAAIAAGEPWSPSGDEEEGRILRLLEEIAVAGSAGAGAKEAASLLAALSVSGETLEEAAFHALRALGLFTRDENLFVRRHGLQTDMPRGAEALAERAVVEAEGTLAAEVASGARRDLTHLEAFSIDDELTSEIDDALSIEPAGAGRWLAGIHIADPGVFVLPGTDLDRLAESRAVTYYLPERRVLMLPSRIAEDAAALLPGVVRPALSFFATLDERGALIASEIAPSVIRSRARVTYEEVDAVVRSVPAASPSGPAAPLVGPDAPPAGSDAPATGPADHAEPLPGWIESALLVLHRLALALEEERVLGGAHVIRAPEVDLSVAPDGTIDIKRLEGDGPGRLLVSEMMILTGRIAARFCLERGVPCVYRRQPPPDEPFPAVRSGPYDPVAVRKARRGLRRGETGLAPGRHHALGLDAYTQATSPIRRYQDLVVHRQIKSFLALGKPQYDTDRLQRIAATTDEAERIARLAERGSDEYWTLRYLERQIGRRVEGVVVYRDPRRVEVELSETLYTVAIAPRPDLEPGRRLVLVVESVNPRGPSIRLRILEP